MSKLGRAFTIQVSITGKNGPVSIVPPDPGTDACLALQLGVDGTSGSRYDVLFGPGRKIKNKDGTTTTTTSSTTTTTAASPSGTFLKDAAVSAG